MGLQTILTAEQLTAALFTKLKITAETALSAVVSNTFNHYLSSVLSNRHRQASSKSILYFIILEILKITTIITNMLVRYGA